MATRKIRVIRTWEADVVAEYGDTDAMLKAKVSEDHLDATPPNAETRVIVLTAEQQADVERRAAEEAALAEGDEA